MIVYTENQRLIILPVGQFIVSLTRIHSRFSVDFFDNSFDPSEPLFIPPRQII